MNRKNHLNFEPKPGVRNTIVRESDEKNVSFKTIHQGETNKLGKEIKNTVIISHFDRVDLVRDAVKSILNQILPDGQSFEVIVIDDCSNQDLQPVIAEFENDPRFSLYSLAKNHGDESLPQNVGIYFAKGEYVSFLDSDDEYIGTSALAEMNKVLDANPEATMACSDILAKVRVNVKNTLMSWIETLEKIEKPDNSLSDEYSYFQRSHKEYSTYDLLQRAYYSGIRMMRKSALEKIGGWNEKLGSNDDRGMVLDMHAEGGIVSVNLPLYLWKIHEANDSMDEMSDEVIQEIKEYLLLHAKHHGLSFNDLQNNCPQEFLDFYKFTKNDFGE
jgi:glycosyltransferase involved in cell wall biosynthesis